MEILETFPRVFCFPKLRINENGGKSLFLYHDHFSIGHVQYINILTWLRDFQDKLLVSGVIFLVTKSFLGIKRRKKFLLKIYNFGLKV